MLRLCTIALALMACGVVAAPAPVFKPPKVPKTPYEVMLAGMRKTGKATGPRSKDGGTWTLTAEKVEGERLTKVVLTCLDSNGRVLFTFNAPSARIGAREGMKGVFGLVFYKVVIEGYGLDGSADEKTVELSAEP